MGVCIQYGWNPQRDAEVVIGQHLAMDNANQVTEELGLV